MNYNKVIYVSDYKAKYGGNFLSSFSFLANKLRENNINVYFIFPKEAKKQNWEIDLSNFNVIYSDFSDKKLINAINSCLTKSDTAIIHLNFLSSLFQLKLKNKVNGKVKFVFHQHMAVNFGVKQTIKGIILRLFAPSNTAYIGVSPEVYKDVKKEVGEKDSYLVLNAIDTKRLALHERHSNSNILIFGTDFTRKGVDLAIEAIQHSKIEDLCKLIIVTHDIINARKLILNKFNIIPKFVQIVSPIQNVQELYNNSFLFLSPSRLEAFGYAVVEAAYSGIQVIASDVPGQNILSEIPGIKIFQSENVAQLSSEIDDAYLGRNNNRQNINKVARQYIDAHFSLDYWATNILKIYDLS